MFYSRYANPYNYNQQMNTNNFDPANYIMPLNINGLSGRVLTLPDYKKQGREILFVYGQHSSLERWWGLEQELNKFGAVTVPDLPGFGGMTSLYKIGRPASVDNLADYLAAFIKLRYKSKKVTIVAMSLGFVIATRMLQKYPDLTNRVEMLVSVMGPAHKDDFVFSPARRRFYVIITRVLSWWLPALLFQSVFLQPFYLRRAYKHSRFAKEKFADMSGDEFRRTMDMELHLWKVNDIRTQMRTNYEMMTLDNTKKHINLQVYHVASHHDRYFNHVKVEEHFRLMFTDFHIFYTRDPNHAPTIIADSEAAAPFIPDGLRKVFSKKAE